jgi:hypothetical protein
MVRGEQLPQPFFHMTTNSEHGSRDWDKVSLPPMEAFRDGMSPSPLERSPPWTPLDEDIVCRLVKHKIRQASSLEQASEHIWHDENSKVSNLMSYVHCWPNHEC